MENIKYHDNKNGPQYGADGKLTSNWNTDFKYGEDEYARVYFRVRTPSYYFGSHVGFSGDRMRDAFYEEAKDALEEVGWTVSGMTDAKKEKAHLYIHPQEISGVVLKNDVKEIAESLHDNENFHLEWVDIYETVHDLSDDQYREYLLGKKEEVRKRVLALGVTKRRDLFHLRDEVAENAVSKVKLLRVGKADTGSIFTDNISFMFACDVIDELAEEGYVVKALGKGGRILARTINKAEQKQRKLPIDAA